MTTGKNRKRVGKEIPTNQHIWCKQKKRENMNIYLTSTKSNYYKTIPTMAGTCFSHCSAYQTDQLCVHKDINIAVTVRVSMNVHGSDSCWRLNNFKNTQTYPNMCAKKQYCLI